MTLWLKGSLTKVSKLSVSFFCFFNLFPHTAGRIGRVFVYLFATRIFDLTAHVFYSVETIVKNVFYGLYMICFNDWTLLETSYRKHFFSGKGSKLTLKHEIVYDWSCMVYFESVFHDGFS